MVENRQTGTWNPSHRGTPLIERYIWMRLDVAPFAILYICLVALDRYNHGESKSSSESETIQIIQKFAFPLVLLLHLGCFLLQQWNVTLRCIIGYHTVPKALQTTSSPYFSRWTHVCMEAPTTTSGSKDMSIVPILRSKSTTTSIITFQDIVFRATKGPDLEMDGLWSTNLSEEKSSTLWFHPLRYPVDLPIDFYKNQWKGHSSLESVQRSQHVYGINTTIIQLPAFFDILGQQLLAPFFLFQLFCVFLWSLDEYWYYAIFTLLALVMFECTVAFNRLKSLERLRGTLRHPYQITVYRHGIWMLLRTDELVPGDWVSLTSSSSQHKLKHSKAQARHIPADLLILNGSAVVDEALLTGESIPQRKGPLEDVSSSPSLDLQDPLHKQSILFGGTVLLSHTSEEDNSSFPTPPDHGMLCVVLRTGFDTTQGSLLRTMTHSSLKSADGINTYDTFVFVGILLVFAIASALFVLHQGWLDESRNRFRLILHVIIIVTSVVPPELPMELSLAVTNSVADLIRHCHVFCTEPFRIPWAGKVDVCCFDKTGTLTSDDMQLKGICILIHSNNVEKEENKEIKPITILPWHNSDNSHVPWENLRVMVACQSLSVHNLSTKKLIGDPMERAILESSGYTLEDNRRVVPLRDSTIVPERPRTIVIHHRFAFSSRWKRMTVLITEDNNPNVFALTKGAPEVLKDFLLSVPDNYDEVYQHHMRLGQRVLAMAFRNFGSNRSIVKLKEAERTSIEKDLTFCGFLILECPLKPDSKHVIAELRKSLHETVMITGDAVLTGAEVARQVGIIDKNCGPTYELLPCNDCSAVANLQDALSKFQFVPLQPMPDRSAIPLSLKMLPSLRKKKEANEASFCVSGAVMAKIGMEVLTLHTVAMDSLDDENLLLHPIVQDVLKDLVPILSVYARHAPRQKEAIIAAYNLTGKHTMMTGDGTNDVGALKRAHVGISILSAPEIEAKQRSATDAIAKEQKKEKKARKEGGKSKTKQHNKRLEDSLRRLQEAQNELEFVELGDASMASPFTSRAMSIKCCKDVLQQGRCTLVTMLTIYKILGVNCLVNALILTKLHLHGAKQGDRQLTILGVAVAALFLFVTRGKPLPVLSATRPPSSVLCTQALASIAAQFGVHYFFLSVVTDIALTFVDPYDPSILPDGSFHPNILNSCTFLLMMVATINTFIVNYRGKPFMEGLTENKLLWKSAQACYGVLLVCSLEVFPPLNELFQIAPFPDMEVLSAARDDEWVMSLVHSSGLTKVVIDMGFPIAVSMVLILDTFIVFAVERTVLKLLS